MIIGHDGVDPMMFGHRGMMFDHMGMMGDHMIFFNKYKVSF